jgi:mannose-6-phosphate isomerase-like protein (cupin superfamily)
MGASNKPEMQVPNHQNSPSLMTVIERDAWLSSADRFSGEWQGGANGSGISIIANQIDEIGGGAKLHRHPYAEVFLIRRGRVTFDVGDETTEAGEGQIVVVPGGVPHAFRNPGPEPFEMIDIHEAGKFDTEWL